MQIHSPSRYVWTSIVFGFVLATSQLAHAGWSGLINGVGKGWAYADVRSRSMLTNKVITITNLSLPSASVARTITTGYKTNAFLPTDAATNSFSRIKGLSGGIWQASANAANGDGTDHPLLEVNATITPSDCASITFDSLIQQSQEEFETNGHQATIVVNGSATGGTALWLRGFEYAGDMADVPGDKLDTIENESIEFLKANGFVKFETLILGPFEFGGSNNCPLIVPFTLNSGNLENFFFAADGVTKSLPLAIECPPGIVVGCGQSVTYPPVAFGGCGDMTLSYSPAPPPSGTFPPGSFPVGITPVTVTATDGAGNSTNCTFTVTVTDTNAPVAPTLADYVANGCSGAGATPPTPVATDNCAGTVRGTTSTSFPITTLGTNLVTWRFGDGNGNTNTAIQRVIVNGLAFAGFYSPVNGTGGSCSNVLRQINQGSNIPLKFELKCGSSFVTGGTPPVFHIQAYNSCTPGAELVVVNAVYQNDWHYNWDTTGWAKGIYRVTVVLPDSSSQSVFVRLK